jgi:hypothetical protein
MGRRPQVASASFGLRKSLDWCPVQLTRAVGERDRLGFKLADSAVSIAYALVQNRTSDRAPESLPVALELRSPDEFALDGGKHIPLSLNAGQGLRNGDRCLERHRFLWGSGTHEG